MLTVRSRRQQKVRVLCCCWFSRQPAPLHTRQDEQARAESLTLARSTGQLAVLSIPRAYCSEWLVSLANLTSRSGANPKRNKPSGHVFQILGRALSLRRTLRKWSLAIDYRETFFARDIFDKTRSKAQRAHLLVQDVSPREARQDPIAEAAEPASGSINHLQTILNRVY
jgi:hypothetical protein